MKYTEANCDSLSAFRNRPPLIPTIPPGAAKALRDGSSIKRTVKFLSFTRLVSESL